MSLADKSISSPYIISINSKDRISGTNNSFQSKPVDLNINKYDSVCLIEASIPRSFYNIPSGYNTFTLKEGSLTSTITIPPASYNRINLQTILASLLTQGSPNGYVYTISYPSSTTGDTFKYTFIVSGNGLVQPSFIFTDSVFRQLGFDQNSTNVFVANSLVSSNCINLAYISSAFITSDICLSATYLDEILNYGSFPMMSLCFYQQVNYEMNSREYNPSLLNSWKFSLTDEFDQLIDLNNVPWAITIVFYQRSNTHEIFKSDLQIQNEQRLFNIQNASNDLNTIANNTKNDSSLPFNDILTDQNIQNDQDNIPDFPVLPYGSSSIVEAFLPETKTIEIKNEKIKK